MLLEEGITVSLRTILTILGWTFRGSAYCQLVHKENTEKRLWWTHSHTTETFDDVIFTVQLKIIADFVVERKDKDPN